MLAMYSRAKRLGILSVKLCPVTDDNSLLDEWRVENEAQVVSSEVERSDRASYDMNKKAVKRSRDENLDDRANSSSHQNSEDEESKDGLEEQREFFDLILQLAKQKQINWTLRKRNRELEDMVGEGSHSYLRHTTVLPECSVSDSHYQQTPSNTQDIERRLHLSQGYIEALLKENKKLHKLLSNG